MTLNEREAFWTEQLPIFKEKYWLPEHFEVLEFDMNGGCFDIAEGVKTDLSEEDLFDIYHRVNSGWAMWKKAVTFMREKAEVPAVPASHTHSVTLTCAELKEAYDFGAPDESHEQLNDLVTIGWLENGHSGSGYYVYMTECEDEGSIKLDKSESGAEG
ncbi:hypothetical protein [Acinetobacter seifertii]|uniref:hypothetical protein n=1 Tax=Acinetobacter seifertii TaxID=1530123 RepID=UPI0020C73E6F|nr:hypothetical protein [Acinetobacter seifertii]